MKTQILLLGAAAAVVFSSPVSAAVTFKGTSTVTALNTSDPGLVLFATPHDFGPFTLDTDLGTPTPSSFTTSVLTIGTNETDVSFFEDTATFEIALSFAFESPSGVTGPPVTGLTRGVWLLDVGVVHWDDPVIFNFGNGGVLSLTLNDVAFLTPGQATVNGTFRLQTEPAVPESATWAMMIAGLGAIGMTMRRRARSVSVSFA